MNNNTDKLIEQLENSFTMDADQLDIKINKYDDPGVYPNVVAGYRASSEIEIEVVDTVGFSFVVDKKSLALCSHRHDFMLNFVNYCEDFFWDICCSLEINVSNKLIRPVIANTKLASVKIKNGQVYASGEMTFEIEDWD